MYATHCHHHLPEKSEKLPRHRRHASHALSPSFASLTYSTHFIPLNKIVKATSQTQRSMKTSSTRIILLASASLLTVAAPSSAIDADNDGLNDIWEIIHNAQSLTAAGDADGDGWNNAQESAAGTHPFLATSYPALSFSPSVSGQFEFGYDRIPGKRYRIEASHNLALDAWFTDRMEVARQAGQTSIFLPADGQKKFWRLKVDDVDTDADGVNDAEEGWLGFSPFTNRTDRRDTLDLARVTAGLNATSTISVSVLDSNLSERWPDPAIIVLRRSGGLKPLSVPITFSGTATQGADYTSNIASPVVFAAGVREVAIELSAIADSDDAESTETITVTALAGTGYTLGAITTGTVQLENETPSSLPSAKSAARFLIQAAFGPNEDVNDADEIPENIESLMAQGYDAWIDDQFTRPLGLLQPWTEWQAANGQALGIYGASTQVAWWNRVMGVPKLRPDAPTSQLPDPLRQRLAFALSEILVVSDRPETLSVERSGLANYYDRLVTHAFGNYRDLLYDVAMHPVMGIYLSHLGNVKADPVNNIFPDENFAREIMQLFSIGLWRLNQNGTLYLSDGTDLDPSGNVVPLDQPIPTYDNGDITELARVFTGLSFGNNSNFQLWPRDFTQPMKIWDAQHDCDAKNLFGVALPARTPSAGNTGTAGLADVNAAIDILFHHPNVGPFLGKQLIQRFVTSNPSQEYVERVAQKFADNGNGVRGDLKAVIKAVLLDPEARDPAMMNGSTWGKLREPLLRVVNFANAFNASATGGWYVLTQMSLAHGQDALNAPSVFNFFLPTHSPQGALTEAGKVAPEFQILNATTAVTGANYFWEHTLNDLHVQGSGTPANSVRLNLNEELSYIVPTAQIAQDVPAGPALDPDPLLRRLDLALTGGTLSPKQFQIIREAMLRLNPPTWQWHRQRFRLAVYLITTSPEFNVLR